MRRSPLSLCAAALLGLALAGCLGASTPIQYYTLTSLPRPLGLADGGTGAIVTVLPVALPASIDRPQIVTRTAENQLSLSEYNRWGGSLKEDIGRTLVQNLNVLLAGKPVSILPETLAAEPRYYIAVTVNRLDGRLGEAVWLNAGWTLRDQQAKRTLAIRSFVAEERAAGPGFADTVAAQSRLVEALSREIATELERIVR
jgi:uncharacterized protein